MTIEVRSAMVRTSVPLLKPPEPDTPGLRNRPGQHGAVKRSPHHRLGELFVGQGEFLLGAFERVLTRSKAVLVSS